MNQEKPQSPITKAHLEGVDNSSSKVYDMLAMWYNNSDKTPESLFAIVKSNMQFFLTTYGINLLEATKQAGPDIEKEVVSKTDVDILYKCGCYESRLEAPEYFINRCAFHSCRTSYRLAIDEGIQGIGVEIP